MNPPADSIFNTVLDHTSTEWIEALLVALLLGLALGGAHFAMRRWLHVKDETAPLIALGILAIFAGMIVAGVYVQMTMKKAYVLAAQGAEGRPPGGGGGNRGGGGGGAAGRDSTRLAGLILADADADHDGKLTSEEAGLAAANFVRSSNKEGKESIDRDALSAVLREKMRPPGGGGGQRKGESAPKKDEAASKGEEPAAVPKAEETSKPAP
jgi:hypothetical protein